MKHVSGLLILSCLLPSLGQAAVIYNKNNNQLDLYGMVTGTGYISNNNAKQGDHSFVRLGIKGKTAISSQISGYGRWEYQLNVNQPESTNKSFTRFGYAGLDFHQLGSIDYGRNNGILFDISGWTDGYWTGNLPGMGVDTYEAQDNFMVKRSNGLLTYRNHGLSGIIPGFNLALQYQGRNDGWNDTEHQSPLSSNPRGVAHQNGDGYGISATYTTPVGISFGGAYARSDRTLEQAMDGLGTTASAWDAGIKYNQKHFYLAATYANTSNMTWFKNGFVHNVDNYEVVTQYKFDNGFQPLLAYSLSRARNLNNVRSADLVNYVNIGLNYVFNKNFTAFADYKINLINHNNWQKADSDNVLALGMLYKF